MQRIRIATLVTTTTAVGLAALLAAACNNETATGGPSAAAGGASSAATSGSSETSSPTGQGGKSQASKASSSKASEGGTSQATKEGQGGSAIAEGGSSEVAEGGSSSVEATGGKSQATKGGSSQGGKGGATSKADTTKAAGGTSAAGGGSTKEVGGSSGSKGGASSTGGAAPKGGASSSGGASGASSTSNSTSASTCTAEEEKFSFFMASQAALVKLSGSPDGFGGDLGGLTGADKICQTIADKAVTCDRSKVVWHAFLSTKDANAKDRIGKGPWYDRRGRVLAKTLTDLINERPKGADTAIANDFPNENGVTNHSPEGTLVDNHQTITGSGTDGTVYKQTTSGTTTGPGMGSLAQDACLETWSVEAATCKGWTTKAAEGCPRVGHSWFEGSGMSGKHWISVWNESGCAPGGTGVQTGGTDTSRKIGSGGGYGGFYCFAVTGE